jgi:hypothetical protein
VEAGQTGSYPPKLDYFRFADHSSRNASLLWIDEGRDLICQDQLGRSIFENTLVESKG